MRDERVTRRQDRSNARHEVKNHVRELPVTGARISGRQDPYLQPDRSTPAADYAAQVAEHNRQVADWLRARGGQQAAAAQPSPPAPARRRAIPMAAVPLVAILAVQAALSLRLVWSNTAFEDEALYLWAGHLEIAHWLHGTPIPLFPTYFSGAPVIYPVIGAVADSLGGLAGARILSLSFMLGATGLLWAVISRLYGRTAAFFPVGLWAMLGPTIRLGAFATFDAMALFLVALATWCATGGRRRRDATSWMIAAGCVLALANATKYASALFDPVVIAVAILTGHPPGGKAAWRRGALLGACTTVLIAVLLEIGRGWYLTGISQTTLARPHNGTTALAVLLSSWDWIGAIVVAGLIAVTICLASGESVPARLLVIVLACAALLVPAEQARIHTYTSLSKHVDFGAWFGAVAVGYAAERLAGWARSRQAGISVATALAGLLVPVAVAGAFQARGFYSWPDSSRLVVTLRGLVSPQDRILADNSPTLEYYLPGVSWRQWSNVYGITLPSGRRVPEDSDSLAPYRRALAEHYFRFVILAFTDKPELDSRIEAYLRRDPSYQFLGSVPSGPGGSRGRYLIWAYGRPGHGGRG
jgi:4-amino-4-deoxy-L-arabinose transferase-like glycosyltransferase